MASAFANTEIPVYIGKINYIDYETKYLYFGNLLWPYLHKRKSFEHENELRCLIWQNNREKYPEFSLDSGGTRIPVEIETLVEAIYVSPDSPVWITNLIKDLVAKYDINISVINSSLNQFPLF